MRAEDVAKSADSPTKAEAEIDVKMGSMGMKFSGPVETASSRTPAPSAPSSARQAKEAGGQSNADGTVTITIGGDGGTIDGTAQRQRQGRVDGRGHRAGRS